MGVIWVHRERLAAPLTQLTPSKDRVQGLSMEKSVLRQYVQWLKKKYRL